MSLEKLKAKSDPKENPFLNADGIEQPFTKEGVLNRNFGKDPTIESSAMVYGNGMLNRAEAGRRTEAAKAEKGLLNNVRERLGLAPKPAPLEQTQESVIEATAEEADERWKGKHADTGEVDRRGEFF